MSVSRQNLRGCMLLAAVLIAGVTPTSAQNIGNQSTPSASSGTFANGPTPPSESRSADGNLFLTYTRPGVNTGTYTGPYVQELEVVIHPNGRTNFRGTTTCVCTVEGQTGTLVIRFQGTGMAGAQFSGSYVVVGGTDGLENLRGQGIFAGAGLTGTYSGRHHFDP
jgi:hypothetical protein